MIICNISRRIISTYMGRSIKKRVFELPPVPPDKAQSCLESSLLQTEQSLMITRAIRSARHHGIILYPGRQNPGVGNCAFEASISNVNDRDCFVEKFPLSPDHYRRCG